MSESSEFGPISWSDRLEKFFADIGEKAHALSWLHKRSQARFSWLKNYTDLPVIILGVINGSVSIGSSSLFGDSPYASICVGAIALLTAILSTVSSYFKWAARSEAHRIAALQYSKLYRFLNVQCSLPREERMAPSQLLKYTRDIYDQLQEISPLLPPEVIREFKVVFNKPEYSNICRPEETNGLEHIEIYTSNKNGSDAPPTSPPLLGPPARHPTLLARVSSSNALAAFSPTGNLQPRDGGVERQHQQREVGEGLQQEQRHPTVST
jgi:hypothetical protein